MSLSAPSPSPLPASPRLSPRRASLSSCSVRCVFSPCTDKVVWRTGGCCVVGSRSVWVGSGFGLGLRQHEENGRGTELRMLMIHRFSTGSALNLQMQCLAFDQRTDTRTSSMQSPRCSFCAQRARKHQGSLSLIYLAKASSRRRSQVTHLASSPAASAPS